jgi:hypothetical protein
VILAAAEVCVRRPLRACGDQDGGARLRREGPDTGGRKDHPGVSQAYGRTDPDRSFLLRGSRYGEGHPARAPGADGQKPSGDPGDARPHTADRPVCRLGGGGQMSAGRVDIDTVRCALSKLGLDFAAEALPEIMDEAVRQEFR